MKARWLGWVCLSVIVVLGCGDSKAKKRAVFVEGTRLKAVYQQADGAPALFVSWYDKELGVDCLFADVGVADRQVCFPTSPVGFGDNLIYASDASAFSDSSCSNPLVYKVFGNERFVLRATEREDSCVPELHLFALGAEATADAAQRFRLRDGACEPGATFAGTAYELGREIPLDTLVSGTLRPHEGSGRIVPLELVASDGAVQPGALGHVDALAGGGAYQGVTPHWLAWDTERREAVSDSRLRMNEPRWLPPLLAETNWLYPDGACTTPVAVSDTCSPPSVAYREEEPLDACGNASIAFVEPGVPVAGVDQLFYADTMNGCASYQGYPQPLPAHLETLAPGTSAIPTTAFAAATTVRTGPKQLQLIQAATADGPAAYPVGFWDFRHGAPCKAAPHVFGADNTVRCLPDAIPLPGPTAPDARFADAACSVPLLPFPSSPSACSPTPTLVSAIETGEGIAPFPYTLRYRFYELGEHFEGVAYGSVEAAQCAELPPRDDVQWYELGAEMPASAFAEVEFVRPE